MFIYYSLHAMDEMIELFSVMMQLEKGALGLFFELNYLIGLFNAGHQIMFHFKHKVEKAKLISSDLPGADVVARQVGYNQLSNFITF